MVDLAVYASLFAGALVAATILPFASEAALAGLLVAGKQNWVALIAVASAGNILGSVVNWAIGRGIAVSGVESRWRIDPRKRTKAEGWYRRYGRWSLLLSWAPVIGDPLTLAAGLMREPFWIFLALVAIATSARYLAVAAIAFQWV